MSENWIVVTTINPPTEAINAISELAKFGWRAVVIGDRKTPAAWSAPNIDYLSVDAQKELFGGLADLIPYNHYSRKNLGYLYAISKGARCILETDDDNIPYPEFGREISEQLSLKLVSGDKWINIYKYFTPEHIWPRGLPLDEIASIGQITGAQTTAAFPVQQYLADLDPDVDAVYRLILNKEVTFERNAALGVEKGSWVPFNSQNTLFYADAFPLLYLPCHVSFRMTDIWRSFVAQQALWVFDRRIAFLPATVKQLRNPHNFMKDFLDEIPGYVENKRIIDILADNAAALSPSMGMTTVAKTLWQALNKAGIVPDIEMAIIDGWMKALADCS